ncbi:MAG: hypothetical protein M3256_25755, partial [Actinomycetota bacterium]|nr:hypothetical protein [Actinomycetota bacterium]
PRAVSDDDLDRLVAEAEAESATGRMWCRRETSPCSGSWPAPAPGPRRSAGVSIAEIDRRPEQPIWRVNKSKGAKQTQWSLGPTPLARA